jgi:hypothetical protein
VRGEPFTPAKLWLKSGPPLPEGAFLRAKTIAYRVDRVRGRTLHCTRWPLSEVPFDALVFEWRWARR